MRRNPSGFDKHVAAQGYHCLYVICGPSKRPAKIGICDNINHRFGSLQTGHWEPLTLHWSQWMAGRRLTSLIESEVKRLWKHRNVRGEWFDVEAEELAAFARERIAEKKWPPQMLLDPEEIVRLLAIAKTREFYRETGLKRIS